MIYDQELQTGPRQCQGELHLFHALFSRTTWVSRHQKGKPFWILLEQEMMGWQWLQLDHMQIICTSLQTDNHTSTHHSIFTGRMPFLPPNPQRQSTEGMDVKVNQYAKYCSQRSFIMAALSNRAGHYIFALWFLSSSICLLFFPRFTSYCLDTNRADWLLDTNNSRN